MVNRLDYAGGWRPETGGMDSNPRTRTFKALLMLGCPQFYRNQQAWELSGYAIARIKTSKVHMNVGWILDDVHKKNSL
jgi:hypothetical protein